MEETNSTPAPSATNASGDNGGQPTLTATPATDASSVSSPTEGGQNPTDTTVQSGQAGQDWSKKVSDLQLLLDRQSKSYNELRGKLVTQGSEKNRFAEELKEMKAQMTQIASVLAKATEAPYDGDQFMEELRAQGPQAIEKHIKGVLEKQAQSYESKLSSLSTNMRRMTTEFHVKECRSDSKNYPDFQQMESTMAEVMNQLRENHKAGLTGNPDDVDPRELVDFLYNEAKLRHSQDALKAAEAHGAAKAASELAKEASTAVVSGGKSTKPVPQDLASMSSSELAELIKAQGKFEVE